jgi:hypothetical protein
MWEVGALAFLHQTTVDLFNLDPHADMLLVAVLAAIWACGCWRLVQMGLYTGEAGLQVRGLLTRRTIPWANVARIFIEHVDYEMGRLRIPAGKAVSIELCDGVRVNSTLWAEGVDFKFRPALFQETYNVLRRRHLDMATARTGTS